MLFIHLQEYCQVIENPIDLITIRENLAASEYSTPTQFAKDVRLIFSNSKTYNVNKRSRVSYFIGRMFYSQVIFRAFDLTLYLLKYHLALFIVVNIPQCVWL